MAQNKITALFGLRASRLQDITLATEVTCASVHPGWEMPVTPLPQSDREKLEPMPRTAGDVMGALSASYSGTIYVVEYLARGVDDAPTWVLVYLGLGGGGGGVPMLAANCFTLPGQWGDTLYDLYTTWETHLARQPSLPKEDHVLSMRQLVAQTLQKQCMDAMDAAADQVTDLDDLDDLEAPSEASGAATAREPDDVPLNHACLGESILQGMAALEKIQLEMDAWAKCQIVVAPNVQ